MVGWQGTAVRSAGEVGSRGEAAEVGSRGGAVRSEVGG